MKILFLGDYSNLHACIASELSRRGHDVTVISDGGSYMRTHCDIHLERQPGKRGTLRYLFDLAALLPRLRGFDIVQIINTHFLSLRPQRLLPIFRYLKKHNRRIMLSLASDDYFFCRAALESNLFRFSEFRVGDTLTEFECETWRGRKWASPGHATFNKYIYENIDGALSFLPEYDMAAKPLLGNRVAFVNIPVDLSQLPYTPLEINGKLQILIGMKQEMSLQKGTGKLLSILRELEQEFPDLCEVNIASNLPLNEYIEALKKSHIIVDQLYSYSPATNALQTMALGRITASGAEPEYYQYISEHTRPIIQLSPLIDIKEKFRRIILNPSPLIEMSRQGRELVERHNDLRIITDKILNHWQKFL